MDKRATAIKEDLLKQLERSKHMENFYIDLVDDYMNLYETKKKLGKDVKDHGVAIDWNNGGGQKGRKKNDSIDQMLKVNQQMIKLLEYLDIKPSKSIADSGGDYDEPM